MISVMKHVAEQQKQQRRTSAGDRRNTNRWSRMPLPDATTTSAAGTGGHSATTASGRPTQAFIYYKRRHSPARGVLAQVSAALCQAQNRFFEPDEGAHLDWAEHLAREIKRSNVVVAVLSNQSIASEIIEDELAPARDTRTPQIFVLRLPSSGAPPYPLRHYLNRIDDLAVAGDVHELAAELRRAFAGAAAAQPRHSTPAAQIVSAPKQRLAPPLPCATPDPSQPDAEQQSTFYVERPADSAALQAIRGQGITIAITGARQVGKTSLLARTTAAARRQGKQVLTLDFQLFEQSVLSDPDRLFRYLCEAASMGLGVDSRVDAFWGNLGNSYNCTQYFEHYLLERLNAPLVLAVDKLERIPNTALRSSFFGMLRAWCDNRATKPIWNQLDLVLATSSAAQQLVTNPYQSPFNTGLTIILDDFTPAQIADLNQRHGQPFAPHQQQALAALLGGHPYLIRQALYLAATGTHTAAEIIDTTAGDGGVFGEHLRYHLFKLCGQPRLIAELHQIISHGASADEWACDELCDAGLVRRDGQCARARCQLYTTFFRAHL